MHTAFAPAAIRPTKKFRITLFLGLLQPGSIPNLSKPIPLHNPFNNQGIRVLKPQCPCEDNPYSSYSLPATAARIATRPIGSVSFKTVLQIVPVYPT